MAVRYRTRVIGEGNHASLHIPDEVLVELGANRRAAVSVTVNGHTYRSTATAVAGECRVVFPMRDREAAGVSSGDEVLVQLRLETGRREVEIPEQMAQALAEAGCTGAFENLSYSHRRDYARWVADAKGEDTRARRIAKIIEALGE